LLLAITSPNIEKCNCRPQVDRQPLRSWKVHRLSWIIRNVLPDAETGHDRYMSENIQILYLFRDFLMVMTWCHGNFMLKSNDSALAFPSRDRSERYCDQSSSPWSCPGQWHPWEYMGGVSAVPSKVIKEVNWENTSKEERLAQRIRRIWTKWFLPATISSSDFGRLWQAVLTLIGASFTSWI
jgi:hypothetical protein